MFKFAIKSLLFFKSLTRFLLILDYASQESRAFAKIRVLRRSFPMHRLWLVTSGLPCLRTAPTLVLLLACLFFLRYEGQSFTLSIAPSLPLRVPLFHCN